MLTNVNSVQSDVVTVLLLFYAIAALTDTILLEDNVLNAQSGAQIVQQILNVTAALTDSSSIF